VTELTVGRLRLDADPRFRLGQIILTDDDVVPVQAKGGKRGYRASFVVTTSGAPVEPPALRAYVDGQVREIAALPGFKQLGQEDGPGESIYQRHQFSDDHGVPLEQLQLYVARGGPVVVGTATHLAGVPFKAMEPVFRKMLNSLTT
jgi:hypothetical protein